MKMEFALNNMLSDRGERLNIKAVLVDFGGTLAYVDEKENKTYHESILSILNKHGINPTLDDLETVLGSLYTISSRGEFKSLDEFWAFFLGQMSIPAHDTLVSDVEEVRRHFFFKIFELYEGVFQTLSAMQRKYRLILVSNCAIGMRDTIDALGLTRFFEHTILSYEVGVRKPNSGIYLAALRAVGLRAGECLFVADEISDLEGAREVGMMTLLVHQGSSTFCEAKDLHFRPDLECEHISEITKFL